MKSNLMSLVRVNFRMWIGNLRYSKRRMKYIPATAMIAGVGVLVLFSMTSNAVAQVNLFLEQGIPEAALYTGYSSAVAMLLLFAFMRGATPNKSSDADFLLSLPLKRGTILLSKSLTFYLFDLAITTVFLLPTIVVYAVMVRPTVWLVLRSLLVFLMLPLLPVGVAYLLSYLMFKISGAIRKPELVRSAVTMISLVGFMVIYFSIYGAMGQEGGSTTSTIDKLGFLGSGGLFMGQGGLWNLLLFALITVAPFAGGVALQSVIYGAKVSVRRSGNMVLGFAVKSPLRALLVKELKAYFAVTIFVVNTFFGVVIEVAAVIALAATRSTVLEFLATDPFLAGIAGMLPVVLLVFFGFCISTVAISASSISLEGKNIRILRSAPVNERDIFLAKILSNLIISAPISVLCIVAAGIVLGFSAPLMVVMALAVLAECLLFATWGLYANLLFPKLDWTNETVVVKQSMAALVGMFPGMILGFAPLLINAFTGSMLLACLISAVFYGALCAVVWLLVIRDGRKRFREL